MTEAFSERAVSWILGRGGDCCSRQVCGLRRSPTVRASSVGSSNLLHKRSRKVRKPGLLLKAFASCVLRSNTSSMGYGLLPDFCFPVLIFAIFLPLHDGTKTLSPITWLALCKPRRVFRKDSVGLCCPLVDDDAKLNTALRKSGQQCQDTYHRVWYSARHTK
jgi:hypothetical protein